MFSCHCSTVNVGQVQGEQNSVGTHVPDVGKLLAHCHHIFKQNRHNMYTEQMGPAIFFSRDLSIFGKELLVFKGGHELGKKKPEGFSPIGRFRFVIVRVPKQI